MSTPKSVQREAMAVSTWWWVRHAPVRENNGRIYGNSDPNCDTSDAASFGGLAKMLPENARLILSPLKRTHQTAAAIAAAGLNMPEGVQEPDLIEQGFGDWQGLTYDELSVEGSGPPGFWLAPGYSRPPGGDSFADLIPRVASGIDAHVQARLNEGAPEREHVISVSHGGVIRAALAIALGLDAERALGFQIDNLSVTRIDRIESTRGISWRVVAVNRLPK